MAAIDLSKVTLQDLEAELAHRQGRSGVDWYFFHLTDEESPLVGIVHKRVWHRHHVLQDSHISHLLTLPQGMNEVSESQFDFNGTPDDIERQLVAFGYQKLEEPYMWGAALFVHICQIGDFSFRIDCTCDTHELRQALKAEVALHERDAISFPDLGAYRAWIESVVPDTVLEFYRTTNTGTSASVMKKDIATSLPTYPEGIEE